MRACEGKEASVARFEDRLWAELVEQHGAVLAERPILVHAPPRRVRRGPIAAVALAVAIALAALVIALGHSGGTSAYAVIANPDGTVTLTIREIAGVQPANERLEELGIPASIPPTRSDCPTSSSHLRSAHLTPEESRKTFEPEGGHGSYSIRIDPKAIPSGDTLVLKAYELPSGAIAMQAAVIEGPAPSCLAPDPGQSAGPTGTAGPAG
jgi:hypothetical protein